MMKCYNTRSTSILYNVDPISYFVAEPIQYEFKSCIQILALIFFLFTSQVALAQKFEFKSKQNDLSIVYAPDDPKLNSISANLLANDIHAVFGYRPKVYDNLNSAKGKVIIIGTANSILIKGLTTELSSLDGKWESYKLEILSNPVKGINQAMVITGSDVRGTAYGVFSVSEKIGVSPWYWWADVTPVRKKKLLIDVPSFTSAEPTVKYRGIFINDEDWGLQPWAAKTFEPETGDIGPKTYQKVFELLLRLKANLIWPAMHPSTKAFYTYPGNIAMARDFQIIVGSSHAEPMLRNNVGEWDEKNMGHFNYLSNRQKVYEYWESRIKQSRSNNVIYTMGMRGIHDGAMEGVESPERAVPVLENIIKDQRTLLSRHVNPDAAQVPQVLTIYKEVLDNYEAGLKVPEDITLVWPDDNYGYIQRLSNEDEQKRKGGSGVYYHASYWGRPHDYLWLSSTHPGLIREEMTKAYLLGARNLWVINIGDIKPAEYDLQLFTDMAYDITPFIKANDVRVHQQKWLGQIFGPELAPQLNELMWKYYQLAFERRPEFMGWSQTEPTTPTKQSGYNHTAFGDQGQQRVDAYLSLEAQASKLSKHVPSNRKDAWYELIEYPLTGASLINQKFLYADKANLYARQGRKITGYFENLSRGAYERILKLTEKYNDTLANGKWRHMMSMNPRNLPAYDLPKFRPIARQPGLWGALPEGATEVKDKSMLPRFDQNNNQKYFIDLFLLQSSSAKISITPSADWIIPDHKKVELYGKGQFSQQRLWVSVDFSKVPKHSTEGSIEISDGAVRYLIYLPLNYGQDISQSSKRLIFANDHHVSLPAAAYARISAGKNGTWSLLNDLGSTGSSLQALPLEPFLPKAAKDGDHFNSAAFIEYEFQTFQDTSAVVSVFTLPTHPINKALGMRYGLSIDNGPIQIMNFETVGRSEEWKENVLSNSAIRQSPRIWMKAGKHTLKIIKIDPGVILDRIFVDLGSPGLYGVPSQRH